DQQGRLKTSNITMADIISSGDERRKLSSVTKDGNIKNSQESSRTLMGEITRRIR
ncbi:hypothetical protein CHS0354_036102, partial [Potamilus streckersoni]